MKRDVRIHWIKLTVAFIILIALSFGLSYLLQNLVAKAQFALRDFGWLAYLIVFGTSLVSNLTIIAPVPFAVSIMVAAATEWNPVLIALLAGIGGGIGELSGYYAGYFGRKIAISDGMIGRGRIEGWIQRYGAWAIFVIALQPVIPFDIGGLIAGAAKMPVRKFLPALIAGRFIKYTILIYAGLGLINFLPFRAH